MKMAIFSDLDGSLLDHESYSFQAAIPSLDRIKRLGVPLILTTSKTRREVEVTQREIELSEPFIVENGAAIFFPAGYRGWKLTNGFHAQSYTIITLGKPYEEIRAFAKRMTPRFRIRGFGDMSVKEIADITGLSLEKAMLAREREFTEPFLIGDESDIEEMGYLAAEEKMKIVRGGIFYHVIGVHQDKGEAVKIARSVVKRNTDEEVLFVGIGDSANDIPMLEHVDIPIVIPHADSTVEKISLPNLVRAPSPGSRGWNEVMKEILDDYERNSA